MNVIFLRRKGKARQLNLAHPLTLTGIGLGLVIAPVINTGTLYS